MKLTPQEKLKIFCAALSALNFGSPADDIATFARKVAVEAIKQVEKHGLDKDTDNPLPPGGGY